MVKEHLEVWTEGVIQNPQLTVKFGFHNIFSSKTFKKTSQLVEWGF